MSKYRRTRTNDEMTRVIAEALRTVKDPRVAASLITVTKSDVTGDLKYAKIFFSVFGADADKIKEIKKGLYSAAGYLRSYVARELNLRATPELTFEYDNAMQHGEEIMRLMKSIEKDGGAKNSPEKTESEESGDE